MAMGTHEKAGKKFDKKVVGKTRSAVDRIVPRRVGVGQAILEVRMVGGTGISDCIEAGDDAVDTAGRVGTAGNKS